MINNIIVDVICMVVILVISFTDKKLKKSNEPDIKILYSLMSCSFIAFCLDIAGILLDGQTFKGARTLLWIVDTAYWLPHTFYCCLWLIFADYHTLRSRRHLRKVVWVYMLPMLAEVIIILTNPITEFIFYINEKNEYTPGYGYNENLIPYVICIAFAVRIIAHGYRAASDQSQKRCCQSMIIFMMLPACGIVLEVFVYGAMWIWPLITLSVLMAYLSLQQQYLYDERIKISQQIEKNAVLENELTNSRVKIMLSQIQPHFLYNSLSVIQALCETEPDLASEAMVDFTDFLRGNMDSLTADKLIPFEKELSHTKCYLSLEKLRFEDSLTIEYDIKTDIFRLPPLTLQPVVENAVRYGVTKREEGGTVKIQTSENETSFIITVSDDGMGFDTAQIKSDGRSHIGIENVRNRLKTMCGGTLEIESTYNVGTVAVITVPK